ncbi:hypothetical protein ISF_05568 [Cordyceps fumosorosea ARSEF 2679]|uniref:Uncharacterized protein n=1 Tax=Cordyceps fumosorosea (strain ARSEF 2679) TaxID=1081104 RepID=A0A167UDV3_CORFA|nr:hypothetical protein ISF_05568 [Cordyceps fumosorosea ARSEF 2679]OAA61489.1 hypothetical protein ISF_05568 [Cordyceps fumosorosea ARSEF 2679]
MDRLDTLLINARDRLGCSGLRNLHDLGQMRQETLEKRIAAAQHRLTVRNTLSIYTAWLWERAFSIAPKNLQLVIEKWCVYLWGIGCTREMARVAWTEAQAMLGPFLLARPPPPGAVHMKIGSSITNQFPTAPIAKRKLDVLEDGASPDELTVDDKTRRDALPPSAKRQKASHTAQGIAVPPMYQSLPLLPLPTPAGRGDFLSLSPRNGDESTRSIDSAARRGKEENEAIWAREDFRFNFRSEYSFAIRQLGLN